jgi:hypothetical protein
MIKVRPNHSVNREAGYEQSVKVRCLKKFRRRMKGVYIPCLILLLLFVLTCLSQATFSNGFEGYDVIDGRSALSFVPNSSDINIILSVLNLNPSAQEVEYSFYIQAWLDINMTEIGCHLQTYYSTQVFVMKNFGRASYDQKTGEAWGWYYQIENTMVINENISGFSQRFPYDDYSMSFSMTLFTQGLKPTFNETFQPTVFTRVISGWNTEAYSRPIEVTDSLSKLDIGVVLGRDTLVSVLQFMVPTMAIYLLMGFSLFTGTPDKLKDRISLFLTTAVLTLSFYTFLLSQLGWIPLFVQNLAISLIISNVILVVFSIISSSESKSPRNWDLYAMTLASITPIVYLLLSAFNLVSPLLQRIVANPLWIIQNLLLANVDYRFLLWLIIFELAFWSAFFSKENLFKKKAIVPITFITGLGILVFNSLKGGIVQEIAFTTIGIAMIVVSLVSFFSFSRKSPEQSSDFRYAV